MNLDPSAHHPCALPLCQGPAFSATANLASQQWGTEPDLGLIQSSALTAMHLHSTSDGGQSSVKQASLEEQCGTCAARLCRMWFCSLRLPSRSLSRCASCLLPALAACVDSISCAVVPLATCSCLFLIQEMTSSQDIQNPACSEMQTSFSKT